MKRVYMVVALLICLFMTTTAFAIEYAVPPNMPDALTTAIDSAASQGYDVLVLARGGIYPVSSQLKIDTELTIKAADGDGAKPVVVRLAREDGTYPNPEMNITASTTLQNVKFTGKQATSPTSVRLLNCSKVDKLHLDGVVVERFRQGLWPDPDTLIVENCLFSAMYQDPGGWGFTIGGQRKTFKYVRIQNNTALNCPFTPWLGIGWGNYLNAEQQLPIVIFDHNTCYNIGGNSGAVTMFSRTEKIQFTNNLFINAMLRPLDFFSDKYVDFPENTVDPDSVETDNTISYVGPKGLWVITVEMTDSAGTVMEMRNNNITWTSDVLAVWDGLGLQRPWVITNNGWMAVEDTSNAYFGEEVTFTNAPDVPMMAVNAIAAFVDTATEASNGATPYTGWNWWDENHNPVFSHIESESLDMSYNGDAVSFTAGDGGYPLGDLNWFPPLKAAWLENPLINSVDEVVNPVEFELSQNYPNPFNPTTEIMYTANKASDVKLTVFNTLGQNIKTLVNEKVMAGKHTVSWDGTNEMGEKVVSGVYFYQLDMGNTSKTMKMLLLK